MPINVTTNTSNISVNATTNTITVGSTPSNVTVSTKVSGISNTIIRNALTVSDTGGDGSLTYSSGTGIFTYTGPSAAEVRSHFSATAPITLTSGVIAINESALFSGKTTDDLAEGTTNLYLNGTGTTSNLTEGTNLYFTDGRSRASISVNTNVTPVGNGALDYNSVTGVITYTPADSQAAPVDSVNGQTGVVVLDTGDLQESGNLFYTDARSRGAISIGTAGGSGLGELNYNSTTGVFDFYGVHPTSIRAMFSGVSPITFNSGNGEIGLDGSTLLDNSTTDDLAEGTTNLYFTTDRSNTAVTAHFANASAAPFVFNGNVDVQGNLNYVNVEDLLVNDRSITLNYGNVAQDAQIIVDRTGAGGSNVDLKWNETTDKWQFTNDGTTYQDIGSFAGNTTDSLPEGTNNLYFSNTRVTAAILGNEITTKDILETVAVGEYPYNTGTANVSGTWSIVPDFGSRFHGRLIGDITFLETYGVDEGHVCTLVMQQDSVGGRVLDLTTTPSNWTDWTFVNDYSTLSSDPDAIDVMTFFKDTESGKILASLINFTSSGLITNAELENSNVIINGKTINLGDTTDLTGLTGNITLTGNVNGTYFHGDGSNITGLTTTIVAEGTNQYYTDARSRAAISASGDLSYDSATGVISYTEGTASVTSVNTQTGAVVLDTDDISEGTTNIYFSTSGAAVNTDNLTEGTNNLYYTTSRFNTDFGNKTTTDLSEGTNLYYTDGRFDTRLATKSTSDIAEGTNLYYTDGRFDTRLATKSTSDIAEGTNLYYTQTRFDTAFGNKSTTNLTEGTNLYYTDGRFDTRLATKDTDDLSEGTNNLYYTTTRFDNEFANKSTSDLSEGTNLYYTDARVDGHLNTGGASTGEVLSWNGTDYDWIVSAYGNVEVANFLANGFGSNTITTTGDITTTGFFEGDLNGAVTIDVYNNTGSALSKGDVVYLTGGETGANPHVALADSDDATKMPAIGVIKEQITINSVGQVVTSGEMNDSNHGYTLGADLYVDTTAGQLTTTIPTGEDKLIQKIGKVVGQNHILVQGAFRTNATPNLNEGNIFLGDTNNAQRTVTPSNNFDTLANAFDLSNNLTNIDSIQSGSGNDLSLLSNDKLVVKSRFGANNDLEFAGNIASDGYALMLTTEIQNYGMSTGAVTLTNSSSQDIEVKMFKGSTTAGSADISITDGGFMRTMWLNFNFGTLQPNGFTSDFTNAKAAVTQYHGYNDFLLRGFQYQENAFPDGVYVESIDTVNNTITMSAPAIKSVTFTDSSPLMIPPAAVDTTTGLVFDMSSEYDWNLGASKTAIPDGGFNFSYQYGTNYRKHDAYGYPITGPTEDDMQWALGSSSDWVYNLGSSTASTFMRARNTLQAPQTVFKAEEGLLIGKNTNMSIRGTNDASQSFGINMMWDGLEPLGDTYNGAGSNLLPQISIKQFSNNTFQNSGISGAISKGGPRLFFTSATGDVNTPASEQYPRANQELGRIAFYGTAGDNTTPSVNDTPAFISVVANQDYDTSSGSRAGPAGLYMAASGFGDASGSDVFMSYEQGELVLASGRNQGVSGSEKSVIIAPANQTDNGNAVGRYSSTSHKFADFNYHTKSTAGSDAKGSKLSVVQGTSSASAGNLALSLNREAIAGTANVNFTTAGVGPAAVGSVNLEFLEASDIGGTSDSILVYNNGTWNNVPVDGTAITFNNVAGDGSSTLNSTTYYIKTQASEDPATDTGVNSALGSNTLVYLYTDAQTNTRASASTVGITSTWTGTAGDTNGGYAEYAIVGTNAKEYSMELRENQDNLTLEVDGTTKVTYTPTGDITATGTVTGDVGDFESVPLKQFTETVVALGNQTGDISSQLDANNGSIYTVTATGDITIDSIANAQTGTSMTIIITQDGTGNRVLSSTMKFAGGDKTLSTDADKIDVVSVIYDGVNYIATLAKDFS